MGVLQNDPGLDVPHTNRMKQIVAQYGWPGKSLVGKDGADRGLAARATCDPRLKFMARCLALMEAAPQGEVSRKDMAYSDRSRPRSPGQAANLRHAVQSRTRRQWSRPDRRRGACRGSSQIDRPVVNGRGTSGACARMQHQHRNSSGAAIKRNMPPEDRAACVDD